MGTCDDGGLQLSFLLGGEVGFGACGVGAGEGVDLCFLVGCQAFDFCKLRALELPFLIGFAGGAIAFEVVATVDVIRTRLGLGLFDELGLGDGRGVVFDEGDFFPFEEAGFGRADALDAADGEFAGPEAVLRKGYRFGFDGPRLGRRGDLGSALCFGKNLVHAGEDLFFFEELISSGNEIFSFAIDEADYGVVPRGLLVFFKKLGFGAWFVVAHEKRDKIILD